MANAGDVARAPTRGGRVVRSTGFVGGVGLPRRGIRVPVTRREEAKERWIF